jgi:hypothetical protein
VTVEAVLAGPASTRQGLARGRHGHWVIQFPLEERVRRLVVGGPGRAAPKEAEVTADDVRTVLREVFGDEIELVGIRRAARVDDSARQIPAYRAGRVFFAGDAAHIHLPLAGQGLNTGLGDAFNLGWKLAGAVHGWAPDGLLDTYHAERQPVGARVLANTQAQGLLMDWAGTAKPDLPAARAVLAELLRVPEAMRWMAGMMTGLDIGYRMAEAADHPLVGQRMPDFELTVARDRRRAHTLLRTGRGLLLGFTIAARATRVPRPTESTTSTPYPAKTSPPRRCWSARTVTCAGPAEPDPRTTHWPSGSAPRTRPWPATHATTSNEHLRNDQPGRTPSDGYETDPSLSRIGEPADVADVVAFLTSDQARWVTGRRIAVDGGLAA